jgi:signal transduction histidine kinase
MILKRLAFFEKGYRGEWSKKIHHEGLGIGLYIAKIVAEAHNLEIKVRSLPKHYQREGIPMHANIFSIKLLIGGSIERRNILKS